MKIVTGRTMAEIDRISIHERGIPSLSLMERAGRAAAGHFHSLCGKPGTPVTILCGGGNNGGDGLVVARRLLGWGYRPHVVLTHPPEKLSPDSRSNFERYVSLPFSQWSEWGQPESAEAFRRNPVVVDALLGTGAAGVPRSPFRELIEETNDHASWSLGIDIASGVDANSGEAAGEAVQCRSTLTFGLPKVGHFKQAGLDSAGTLSIAAIGFPSDLLENAESEAELVTSRWATGMLPRYPRSVHKGDRGKVLILAGSAPLLGAAILSTRAALRTGAGLVTLALPKSLNAAVKGCVPEAMTLPLPETEEGTLAPEAFRVLTAFAENIEAVAIGPGLGRTDGVRQLVREVVERIPVPMVIDADALFALSDSQGREILRNRQATTVLTPHAGEFQRLTDGAGNEVEADPWRCCQALAEDLKATVLLKGPATLIAAAGHPLRVNRSGHPSMSQGGMGDVLTGAIAAFLGEGLSGRDAASLGAFVHGRAGEWAHRETGSRIVSAGETIEGLSRAFREIGSGL